ncbi:MAG TPA: hypothetical protein VMF32_01900 [Xanthobacteraceae bacterium]|nr:hypothetical protein [Xanthobacteraceae bacterium]
MSADLPPNPSPSLVPASFVEMLRDADQLLALMGSEPLGVVADLASQLTASANDAGASEVARAASMVGRLASAHDGVALTGAMHHLTSAITDAQRAYHVDEAA